MERKLSFATEETIQEPKRNDSPKIYSKVAVLSFSIFFSAIVGGILLAINLSKVKKNIEILWVLLFSVSYTVLTSYLLYLADSPGLSGFFSNIIGGAILTQVFYSKHIPGYKNYPVKEIWIPLIICIVLTMIYLLIALFPILIHFL